MIPNDPFMLYSYVNMKLRDEYPSLEEMCASMDIDEKELKAKLSAVGFEYDAAHNKFV